jgi:hypothetical protein
LFEFFFGRELTLNLFDSNAYNFLSLDLALDLSLKSILETLYFSSLKWKSWESSVYTVKALCTHTCVQCERLSAALGAVNHCIGEAA